jgi:phage shock protein A
MSILEKILKRKAKEHAEDIANQNYSFVSRGNEIREQVKSMGKEIDELEKEIQFLRQQKNKKTPMKTTKVHNLYKEKIKNRLSEIENKDNKISNEIKNAMEKYNKNLNIEVHKPKKTLMKTTKVHNPHKEKLDKITKEVEKAFIKYTPKYIEHDKSLKPKNPTLNKILELLKKALTYNEHVKLIQNAIKYVEKLNK